MLPNIFFHSQSYPFPPCQCDDCTNSDRLIATPAERARDFRDWVAQLPTTLVSLPDEAFSRDRIYEE